MIPVPNRHVSGGGLRAWGLGEGLKTKGHDVIYSTPKKIADTENLPEDILKYSYQPQNLRKIIRKVVPDVVVFEQWGLATYLEETNIPVVIDLHGSLILENYFRKHRGLHNNVAAKIKTLAKADYIICPSKRQKNYFIPWLMLSGFSLDEESIAVIPVSFSPSLPERNLSSELTFIFSGGLWPWINPFPALDIVAEQVKNNKDGHLKIFSQQPDVKKVLPKDGFGQGKSIALDHLKNIDRVEIQAFKSHENLLREFQDASVAVDIYQWNRERELAFSTRTIEFLWCGLPVIHAEYSEISDYVRKYQAGWCLDPNDVESIQKTVSEIFSDRDKVQEYGKNAQELVKAHFTWDRTIEPLDNYVADPFPKTKKQTFFDLVSLEFDRIEDEALLEVEGMRQALGKKNEEIRDLDKDLTKIQDQMVKEAEKHDLEKDELRTKSETEIKGRDQEIYRLNSELKSYHNELTVLRKELTETKKHLDSSRRELASLREIESQLRNSLHVSEENVEYLQGVLRSIQNRFPYRLYKVISYRSRRLFVQYPRLMWLFMINFFTNTYMSRWCKKKGTRIFPAQ